jgi:hypothetical protein
MAKAKQVDIEQEIKFDACGLVMPISAMDGYPGEEKAGGMGVITPT